MTAEETLAAIQSGEVDALMRVARASSVTVSKGNERPTDRNFNRALPFAFAGLLLFAILIGGQTLLTQMVEEKSSRVIEVLLSAVSPIEYPSAVRCSTTACRSAANRLDGWSAPDWICRSSVRTERWRLSEPRSSPCLSTRFSRLSRRTDISCRNSCRCFASRCPTHTIN